jgi:iron complex outermembrane receptor protein
MSQDLKRSGIQAKVTWRTRGLSLTSLTAFRKTDALVSVDFDFTEVDWASNSPATESSEAFSQEIQFTSSETKRHQWIAGVFLLRDDAAQSHSFNLPFLNTYNQPSADNTTNAWAVYGQGNYRFTHRLRGTAGMRYSYEKKHHVLVHTVNGVVIGVADDTESWESLTPKIGLEYYFGQQNMLYASVTRGFKSGGFNSTEIQPSFDPENIWSYEAGVKTSLADKRLLANFYGFYYDYADKQIHVEAPENIGFPVIDNAANAEIKGIEAEFLAARLKRWDFSFVLAYLNARFTEFVSISSADPEGDPDQSGNRLSRAPDFSASASVAYSWPLHGGGLLTLHGGYKYQSLVYFNDFEDPRGMQDAYDLWDASLRYDSPKRRWNVAIRGTNLADQLFAQNAGGDLLLGTRSGWGPPRTIALTAGVSY